MASSFHVFLTVFRPGAQPGYPETWVQARPMLPGLAAAMGGGGARPGSIVSCVRGSGLAVIIIGPGILAGFGRGIPHHPLQKCGRSAVSPSSPSDNLSWPGFVHGAGQVWARATDNARRGNRVSLVVAGHLRGIPGAIASPAFYVTLSGRIYAPLFV